jgi:hypothetical protein
MASFDMFSGIGELPFVGLFQTLLPDFILSFAFFTALTYAVLSRKMEHQRSAIVMSGAVGMALAVGLVWWEQETGHSIRSLGPIVVGLGVILLGMILFQGIRQTGGTWAGAGIALGASLLIGWILGMPWPVATEIIQTVAIVGLTVGIIAYMLHNHRAVTHIHPLPREAVLGAGESRHDMSDLYEDRSVEERIRRSLGRTRDESRHLADHPQDASNVMERLNRLLPAEGWLTERLAQLRAKAHLIREGHVHRLQEFEQFLSTVSPQARKRLATDLQKRYEKVVGTDHRLDELDWAVAEKEKRVRDLTAEARQALARYDYVKLYELMDQAEKLQRHNEKLLKIIEGTERKLNGLVKDAATHAQRDSQG